MTITGVIPTIGQVAAHNTAAKTFMFFEEQYEWNTTHLTYNLSKKEKQEGFQMPSRTHTYPEPNYFKSFPHEVLASTRYKDDYLTRH